MAVQTPNGTLLGAAELIQAQEEIALHMGYSLTNPRRRYTAAQFAADLNTLHPNIVRVCNGRPHQLYHARRGATRVPPYWEPVVKELKRLARTGFCYPPTPGPLRTRPGRA